MNQPRQRKLAENLCRMNYERHSRRKKWRFRRHVRFSMRDMFWLVFCVALGSIIWTDNAHYRHQVDQIRFDANQARDLAERKMEEVEAREAYLKMKEQELDVKTKQWQERLGQERLGQLTTENPR